MDARFEDRSIVEFMGDIYKFEFNEFQKQRMRDSTLNLGNVTFCCDYPPNTGENLRILRDKWDMMWKATSIHADGTGHEHHAEGGGAGHEHHAAGGGAGHRNQPTNIRHKVDDWLQNQPANAQGGAHIPPEPYFEKPPIQTWGPYTYETEKANAWGGAHTPVYPHSPMPKPVSWGSEATTYDTHRADALGGAHTPVHPHSPMPKPMSWGSEATTYDTHRANAWGGAHIPVPPHLQMPKPMSWGSGYGGYNSFGRSEDFHSKTPSTVSWGSEASSHNSHKAQWNLGHQGMEFPYSESPARLPESLPSYGKF
jgi:hypothetical protein